jgi:hypothetical protein
MKKTLVLALGLLLAPQIAAAQLEVGLDVLGFTYTDVDGAPDAQIGISLPASGARVGFVAGPRLIVETRIEADWDKQGDASASQIFLVPGVNFLMTPEVYLRGEVGLRRLSGDTGTVSASGTQYLFGGAVGMRRPLAGGAALLRFEGGVGVGLENADADIPFAQTTIIHASMGVSAVIN